MANEKTPIEYQFPHLSRVFEYWTFEAEPTIHTTAGCIENLLILVLAFENGDFPMSIVPFRSMLDAAEAAAKDAKPFLDELTAQEEARFQASFNDVAEDC